VWGLADDRIFPERTESPEYYECISDARWWNRQCKQAADLGGYILGGARPIRGWGLGEFGSKLCDQLYEGVTDKCKEHYGSKDSAKKDIEPPDSGD